MSERERWIVYPLLLFALGAAVRDKLLQRVEAREIFCESIKIVDSQQPDRFLAELGIKRARSNDPSQLAPRVGALRLIDSDGREVCEIATDVIVGRLVARELRIIDSYHRPLVVAGTEMVPGTAFGEDDTAMMHQGVIYLNNQRLGIRLTPPTSPPPPVQQSPAEAEPSPQPEVPENSPDS